MLINTVLLFLQNALPIFIITTFLLLRFPIKTLNTESVTWLTLGLVISIIGAFILSNSLENLSQQVDGKGVELFFAFGLLLIYIFSVCLFIFNENNDDSTVKKYLAFIILFIISCLNGAHFIVYLTSYWSQAQQIESMLLGMVLGGGICVSIAILFYFLLKFADRNFYLNTSNYFLLFFAIGQLMHAIVLLQQVDLLSSSHPVWDSSSFIAENSELGQLLTVLFGYETTPSTTQLITYAVAFIIPVIISNSKTMLLSLSGEQT